MTEPVLIVGAGPTGLVLALFLRHLGIPFRIIDKLPGPGLASRAMVIHARTLEFYRQIGIDQTVIHAGIRMRGIGLWASSRRIAQYDFDQIGDDLSPFPYVLSLPQDDHERLLVEELARLGVQVEWNTELTAFTDGPTVSATIRRDGIESTTDFRYLCACDGAHSTVRQLLGLGFPGGTYNQVFFVTDVDARGLNFDEGVNISFTSAAILLAFPVRSRGTYRFIGIVPPHVKEPLKATIEDIRPLLHSQLNAAVQQVHWFSAYRVHHRVVEHFRRGNVFLAGDACHVHSPAGGQGMNTGIGDAVNLAWKLAAALQDRASPQILDSYEPERLAFARTLVETTDRVFESVVSPGPASALIRSIIVPYIIPLALRLRAVRRAQFRLISQTRIRYPHSPLTSLQASSPRAGDRLPWLPHLDNFAPLRSLDWQIHVCGTPSPALAALATNRRLTLLNFPASPQAARAGFSDGHACLVRPDGYIACSTHAADTSGIASYLDRWAIRPRA
ncbi:MAG: FAD-dependent monooxygenase [Phycisphaerales bacterium]